MKHKTPPAQIARARRLRIAPTLFERRLWHLLRERLPWAKFRRQQPVAGYIADFACPEARLIIELDGEQHGLAPGERHDARRDAALRAEGFAVLRIWNNQLSADPSGVIETIVGALAAGGVHAPATGARAGRGHRGRGRRATMGGVTPTRCADAQSPPPSRGREE